MSKFITYLAAGLVLATATAATAAPVCRYGNGVTTAPAPATAHVPTFRRYSYQPGMAPAPVYRNYRNTRPEMPRYLLPKTDARRFST